MGSKKDMRREDLFIPFIEPEVDKNATDMSATIASSVPMAAIFSRQKVIAWVAVVFSTQHWLSETADQKKSAGTPGWFSVLMSISALVITYMPMFLPPPQARSATGPAAPTPPSQ